MTLDYLSGDYDGPNTFKQIIIPYSGTTFLVRFENIGDLFDKYTGKASSTYYVDVKKFAEMFYTHMNGADATLTHINIVETTLSGNQ